MTLEKLPKFDEELEEIVLFIARESPAHALAFFDALIEKIEKIPQNPFLYRKRPNMEDENIREMIFKGYVIPFYIDTEANKIVILGIFGRNLWEFPPQFLP